MAGKTLKELEFHRGNLAEVLGGEGIRFPVQPLSRPGHFALAGNALHRRSHGPGRRPRHRLRQIADGGELAAAARAEKFSSASATRTKRRSSTVARQFAELGFELVATGGTATVLEKAGLKVQRIFKLLEGRPNAIDLLKNKEIQLVINTPAGATPREDEIKIRTTAVYTGTPIMTTFQRRQGRRARHRRAEKIRLRREDRAGISLTERGCRIPPSSFLPNGFVRGRILISTAALAR